MKACFYENSLPISPFGDLPAALHVLGQPLRAFQTQALEACGLEIVEEPPKDEAWLRVGARCWFTDRLLKRFLDNALPSNGLSPAHFTGARLKIVHPDFQALTEPLQDLPAPGVHDLAILPPGLPIDTKELPDIEVCPQLQVQRLPDRSTMLGTSQSWALPLGEEYVHQIDHWSHLLRVNLFALVAWGASEKRTKYDERGFFVKLLVLGALLLKARSLDPAHLASALSLKGKGCRIHPSAVVEASHLGDNVVVDAFSVVRGSWLGDNVHVEDHATVNFSVLSEGARINRFAIANSCVLMEHAILSVGGGFQASVFGKDSFVAMTATILDLCFNGNVKVLHRGHRVDAGLPFLGAAIGHRARVGAGVCIGYGTETPNDSIVAMDPEHILRRWPADSRRIVKI